MQNNKIDSIDFTPTNYFEMKEKPNITCVRPLFISNQLSIMTAIIKQSKYSSLFILQTYNIDVWITLLSTVLLLSLINSISLMKNNDTIKWLIEKNLSVIWIICESLLGKGGRKKLFTISYLFWLISILPIIEILKNRLFSIIINVPERMVNNIDELLDDEIISLTLSKGDFEIIGKESQLSSALKEKFTKLRQKTILFEEKTIIRLLQNPNELKSFIKKRAVLEDQFSMQWLYGTFKRYFKVHIGSQSYFPVLLTPICFRSDFKHIQLANKM